MSQHLPLAPAYPTTHAMYLTSRSIRICSTSSTDLPRSDCSQEGGQQHSVQTMMGQSLGSGVRLDPSMPNRRRACHRYPLPAPFHDLPLWLAALAASSLR